MMSNTAKDAFIFVFGVATGIGLSAAFHILNRKEEIVVVEEENIATELIKESETVDEDSEDVQVLDISSVREAAEKDKKDYSVYFQGGPNVTPKIHPSDTFERELSDELFTIVECLDFEEDEEYPKFTYYLYSDGVMADELDQRSDFTSEEKQYIKETFDWFDRDGNASPDELYLKKGNGSGTTLYQILRDKRKYSDVTGE